ncbi:hypothetical protein [uncultured Nitratireductor sp.]|uniref:hypothetical protein n=1 Tax=uncultured Nitratireductor sp. TaxID=520953 RepID=UPI00262563F8|nr:hypothetical protein [uncultured Nitratireductor sp.]
MLRSESAEPHLFEHILIDAPLAARPAGHSWLAFLARRRIERAAMMALALAYGVGLPLIYATT